MNQPSLTPRHPASNHPAMTTRRDAETWRHGHRNINQEWEIALAWRQTPTAPTVRSRTRRIDGTWGPWVDSGPLSGASRYGHWTTPEAFEEFCARFFGLTRARRRAS